MSSQVPDSKLGEAILQSIEQGGFPQDEHVASAVVPSSALPKLLEQVVKAKEDTKNQIRDLSRQAAPDVDGWIAQARKLQDDIKRSQETAKEIVQEAEAGKDTAAAVQDAASQVSLLHSEIAYNELLARAVEQFRDISELLDAAQNAAVNGHIMHALQTLDDANRAFEQLGPFETTRVIGVLRNKQEDLKKAIVETVSESWAGLVRVDQSAHQISLKQSIERENTVVIDDVVGALTQLKLLDTFIARLSQDLDKIIIAPRLQPGSDHTIVAFEIQDDDIRRTGTINDGSIQDALADVHRLVEYLSTRLPPSIAEPLSSKLIPTISSRLINGLLLPAVPTSTDGVLVFQETLSYVLGLVEYLDELGWSGQQHLSDWVDQSAEIWLAKQKELAIARVQALFPKKVREKTAVERVETQVVGKGDALHNGHDEQEEDWDADWGEETEAPEKDEKAAPEIEEEDMSAWGEEDEAVEETKDTSIEKDKKAPNNEEGEEDWGAEWGDEDEVKPTPQPTATKSPAGKSQQHSRGASQAVQSEKTVTLRETYTVTNIPDSIMDLVLQVLVDVEALNAPAFAKSAISPASGGLFSIPSLLLAMYRATAAVHYSKDPAGNMLIYNDCQRISDRLRRFMEEQLANSPVSTLAHVSGPMNRLKDTIQTDIKAIDSYGKRAYGREMESQRQIIQDYLDDAQGFQGCTNVPFATVCDDAIATTIDRISDVKRQWQNILSHSVLLQSLGSIVSTALTKFITDVEDMSDIAADDSKKLHGYCISLATLAQHFQTEDDNGEMRDVVSIYTPNWFRFQYLGEILDSSLADIKYFWTEGELKLEMGAEEVVSLIEALFAHSDYRRKAIAEIRRTSMHG